jgi:hypothetical protein
MPRLRKSVENDSLLNAALEGLELQKQRIEEQIREVRTRLGLTSGRRGRPPGPAAAKAPKKSAGPRTLSEAARKRIAAAQKRRWAEYRKSSGTAEQ